MTSMTLPHKNGSSAVPPAQTWLQASVQQFFTAINWDDHPPDVQEIKLTATQSGTNSTSPLNLSLSVSRFFAAVNWDGVAVAAPVSPAPQPIQPKPDDLTLDDFSSLF